MKFEPKTVPDRVKPALYLDWANPDDITYEWTYNCSDKFERNVFFVNDSVSYSFISSAASFPGKAKGI